MSLSVNVLESWVAQYAVHCSLIYLYMMIYIAQLVCPGISPISRTNATRMACND